MRDMNGREIKVMDLIEYPEGPLNYGVHRVVTRVFEYGVEYDHISSWGSVEGGFMAWDTDPVRPVVTTPSYPAVLDANGREIKVGDWLDWPSLDALCHRKVTSLNPVEYDVFDRENPETLLNTGVSSDLGCFVVIPDPYEFTATEEPVDYPEYPEEISPKAGPVTLLAVSDSPRADALLAAAECVLQDRAAEHGELEQTFGTIADFWSTYISTKFGIPLVLEDHDTATMMALLKIARKILNPKNKDNQVDGIGYLACDYELASK